jgi:hypothetical protein
MPNYPYDQLEVGGSAIASLNVTLVKIAADIAASTGGDASTNTATSVDSEMVLFSGTTGKLLKRATGTGLATITAGVQGAVAAPSGAVVGTSDSQTLTSKTIAGASNTISGITEAMQSLSDVVTLDLSITQHGYAPKAPNDTAKFLRGDATWQAPPAGGDASTNTATSVDSEMVLFSGTGGKTLKRATGTGLATLAAGVQGTVAAPSGAVVGISDSQTLTNKTIAGANNTISGITEAMQSTSDVTTLNVSTTKHGYAPKAPNDATKYLDGTGAYSVPAGSGGSTQGRHTIYWPASGITPAVTNGATANQIEMATNKNNLKTLQYVDGAIKYGTFDMVFPKAWNLGTLTYQVVWTLNSTSTNSAVFGLQAVAVSNNDVLDVAYGTAIEVTDAGLGTTAYKQHTTAESSALTVAGTPADGDLVLFRLYRDPTNGSDTLAAVAVEVVGVNIYYVTDADNDS